MRSIDGDALIEGYKHMGYDPTEHPEESYMEGWCKGFNAAVDHCMHRVIHAPTVEPQRKTGKWIDTGSGQECSECGEIQYGYDSGRNFCPNCGADMRTKETDYDYERAVEQLEHDILYEPTFNQDDGSM